VPHALTELKLAAVTRPAAEPAHEIRADVCVVGAGIAGLSAAIESARLGRDVVLVDSHQLTLDEVRAGTRFPDAIARTAWPIELHDRADGYVWETFEPDHVHYVPLRSMTPPGVHNVMAAGRCIDGDAAALSSVRVMGPCAAMGAAAAHALDLAGGGSTHDIDLDRLRQRVTANIG
jgi:choline dehydrogenase-like flavoprotein